MIISFEAKANVFNVPADPGKYIVAKISDNDLWYWGSWDSKEEARKAAEDVGGIVLDRGY